MLEILAVLDRHEGVASQLIIFLTLFGRSSLSQLVTRDSRCTRQTRRCCFATHYFPHVVRPFLALPARHLGTLDPVETCNSIRLFFVSAKNQTDPFSHFLLAMLMEKC
nr:MAG TPA: hypothetical protein [Bacteriophage sp.]